eukprot:1159624-Pelagomonas_calceolata.AAC.1
MPCKVPWEVSKTNTGYRQSLRQYCPMGEIPDKGARCTLRATKATTSLMQQQQQQQTREHTALSMQQQRQRSLRNNNTDQGARCTLHATTATTLSAKQRHRPGSTLHSPCGDSNNVLCETTQTREHAPSPEAQTCP